MRKPSALIVVRPKWAVTGAAVGVLGAALLFAPVAPQATMTFRSQYMGSVSGF